VVGAVVIVAAVIIAVVASGKSSGSHGSPHVSAPHAHGSGGFTPAVARSGGGVRAGPPMFPTVPAPRTIPTGPAPRRFPVAPAPGSPPWYGPGWRYGPEVDVDVGFWWEIPLWQEPPPGYPYAYAVPPPMLPPEPPPADVTTFEEPTAEPQELTLAPPVPFPVGERGFFAGDRLALEAVVLDRTSGETLWTKRVSREADPCNPKEVKAAVDALLSDGGWIAPAPDGD
jgi:hypothetical protein